MLNFSIIILLSLILISQNIILLNEETLILLCFIIFCWIGFNKLKDSIYEDFEIQKKDLEIEFSESFNILLKSVNKKLTLQKILPLWLINFSDLKRHLLSLNLILIDKLPNLYVQRNKDNFLKKLSSIKRIEQQTNKLIGLLLIKKIEKITLLRYFYISKIKVKTFECSYKITLREYIEII
uniref:ATP synthase F0 subunit b n=1 Tax=Hydropuntia rangiferina TaxID=338881 RepID=A0A345UBB2_9FLOR|nr:ATP synthase F0 subunit b [Hydropuntia rangiferina]AXI97748.1 ATP synthase F0 subunit b [Hydropuntia rangiferina]UAD89774.1 ATP synthase F0 subunit b [Hydropuntia rangiferina]